MQPRCTARKVHTKEPCGAYAVKGSTVCRMHGGGTPQVKAAAAARLVEQQARRVFGRLGDVSTPITDPLSALANLAGHVNAWMEFLAGRIEDLKSLTYSSEFSGEQIMGEIQLWERALDRCNAVFGTAARLNIDERLAAITERQAEVVMAAIDAALDAAGVAAEQRVPAKRAAARRLRVVA